MPPPWPTEPCGTPAGAKRHQRHHEKSCHDCLTAERRAKAARTGYQAGVQSADHRELRNGLDVIAPYRWRARTYPLGARAVARTLAEWEAQAARRARSLDLLAEQYEAAVSARDRPHMAEIRARVQELMDEAEYGEAS